MVLDFISQSENLTDIPNIMSENYQFRVDGGKMKSLTRLGDALGQKQIRSFEIVRVSKEDNSTTSSDVSYGLYLHPDGSREWRALSKIHKRSGQQNLYKVEYAHERGHYYNLPREDVLLSFEYKKVQENYF